jgi:hypothetical protein
VEKLSIGKSIGSDKVYRKGFKHYVAKILLREEAREF